MTRTDRADLFVLCFSLGVICFALGWKLHEWLGTPVVVHHEQITQVGIDTTVIRYVWDTVDCRLRRAR